MTTAEIRNTGFSAVWSTKNARSEEQGEVQGSPAWEMPPVSKDDDRALRTAPEIGEPLQRKDVMLLILSMKTINSKFEEVVVKSARERLGGIIQDQKRRAELVLQAQQKERAARTKKSKWSFSIPMPKKTSFGLGGFGRLIGVKKITLDPTIPGLPKKLDFGDMRPIVGDACKWGMIVAPKALGVLTIAAALPLFLAGPPGIVLGVCIIGIACYGLAQSISSDAGGPNLSLFDAVRKKIGDDRVTAVLGLTPMAFIDPKFTGLLATELAKQIEKDTGRNTLSEQDLSYIEMGGTAGGGLAAGLFMAGCCWKLPPATMTKGMLSLAKWGNVGQLGFTAVNSFVTVTKGYMALETAELEHEADLAAVATRMQKAVAALLARFQRDVLQDFSLQSEFVSGTGRSCNEMLINHIKSTLDITRNIKVYN